MAVQLTPRRGWRYNLWPGLRRGRRYNLPSWGEDGGPASFPPAAHAPLGRCTETGSGSGWSSARHPTLVRMPPGCWCPRRASEGRGQSFVSYTITINFLAWLRQSTSWSWTLIWALSRGYNWPGLINTMLQGVGGAWGGGGRKLKTYEQRTIIVNVTLYVCVRVCVHACVCDNPCSVQQSASIQPACMYSQSWAGSWWG